MSESNYKELLQVAEMYRDQLSTQGSNGSIVYEAVDTAIKNYYKHNPCPHRLAYIRVTRPSACGCETTETYCPDCDTVIKPEMTDC